MKKNLTTTIICIYFAFLITSCKKGYTCKCEGGNNGPQTQTIDAPEAEAEERCKKSNIEWSATGGKCEFKK